MRKDQDEYLLYQPPIPGCYYLVLEDRRPPKLYWEDPELEPAELASKRLFRVDGKSCQERIYQGMILSWKPVER